MKTETVPVGYFDVRSDQLVVSDPCYDLDTWCAGILKNPKKGKWFASVEKSDQGGWGNRVAELFACHEDFKGKSQWNYFLFDRCDFEVGVDSGQAGIFDLPVFRDKELKKPHLQVGHKEYNDRPFLRLLEINNTLPGGDEEKKKIEQELSRPPQTTFDWYEMCCDKTLGNQSAGTIPGGVVSSSGFGDGGYTAYCAKDDVGQIIAVKVVFIDESDMENEDEDWEEE